MRSLLIMSTNWASAEPGSTAAVAGASPTNIVEIVIASAAVTAEIRLCFFIPLTLRLRSDETLDPMTRKVKHEVTSHPLGARSQHSMIS